MPADRKTSHIRHASLCCAHHLSWRAIQVPLLQQLVGTSSPWGLSRSAPLSWGQTQAQAPGQQPEQPAGMCTHRSRADFLRVPMWVWVHVASLAKYPSTVHACALLTSLFFPLPPTKAVKGKAKMPHTVGPRVDVDESKLSCPHFTACQAVQHTWLC